MAEELLLADDAATEALGARLAAQLAPGDLVLLEGDLGAGKTTLARAIIRTLINEAELEVPSPTFALLQPYAGNGRRILHADLYRIADPREIDELGLNDDPEAIVLVEWAERAPELATRADAVVTLAIPADGAGRRARIAFRSDRTR
ncbi:tRNA (adenosine(37)-N6)-threonylcarbamoyltransferase complex ATPase subunit type 1 TsaE [Devosia sp.]|uniref:tRNA (adenosine(37)-N6)-threonylcarbamoyltransferase complex ATPase subunit type 1 TsaE n=1 Tax=Devosia sp. TaxID=1871048 RepID=UPI0035ADBC47